MKVSKEFAQKLVGSWYRMLSPILLSTDFYKILDSLSREYKVNKGLIFPEKNKVFNAFKLTNYDDLKVVILGQDPYPNNRANGLAFSNDLSSNGLSPSLRKIKERVEYDFNYEGEFKKDLIHWANQGIFLYNTALTVKKGEPGSHFKYWQWFTIEVLKRLSEYNSGLIFCLWGKNAQDYKQYINSNSHIILEAEHPSYAARKGRLWEFDFKNLVELVKKYYDQELKLL